MKKKEPTVILDSASFATALTMWPPEIESAYAYVQLRVHQSKCGHGESILLSAVDARRLGRLLLKVPLPKRERKWKPANSKKRRSKNGSVRK